ncbi:MAG: PEP-CTERM sorting domain-containing protein [Acidobacteriaceae bacterium]
MKIPKFLKILLILRLPIVVMFGASNFSRAQVLTGRLLRPRAPLNSPLPIFRSAVINNPGTAYRLIEEIQMKTIRYFFVIAILCGLSGFAKADPIDFRLNVLDPPANTLRHNISSQPFAFSFGVCNFTLLPPGISPTPVGCFFGRNKTGVAWTGLSLIFPVSGGISTQTANCAPQPNGNIFSSANCGFANNNTQFFLSFRGGIIPNNGEFAITESGAPIKGDNAFPSGILGFTAVPEPGSVLLLSTGALLMGLLVIKQRKSASGLFGL